MPRSPCGVGAPLHIRPAKPTRSLRHVRPMRVVHPLNERISDIITVFCRIRGASTIATLKQMEQPKVKAELGGGALLRSIVRCRSPAERTRQCSIAKRVL